MTEYTKPLPNLDDPTTEPFWRGTRERKLMAQRCPSCSYVRWPPGPLCPECQTRGGEWTEIQPTGTLWSIAEYHRAFDPTFNDETPYTVGLVELDDGPRMYGVMSGAPGSFTPGEAVEAVFFEATTDVTLVRWGHRVGSSG